MYDGSFVGILYFWFINILTIYLTFDYFRCMRLNCDVKYAVGIKSIWDVVCMDCVGSASYLWSLQMWNESVWETVTNFNTITTTGNSIMRQTSNSFTPTIQTTPLCFLKRWDIPSGRFCETKSQKLFFHLSINLPSS